MHGHTCTLTNRMIPVMADVHNSGAATLVPTGRLRPLSLRSRARPRGRMQAPPVTARGFCLACIAGEGIYTLNDMAV